jgi:hypothetical protein
MFTKSLLKISVATIGTVAVLGAFSASAHAATVSGVDIKFPGPSSATIKLVDGVVVVDEIFGNFGNIEKQLDARNDNKIGNQVFNITATNNTNSAWDSFVFDLVGGGGVTSFDQTFATLSDKFTIPGFTLASTKLTFSNGTVAIGDKVNFKFAVNIPDIGGSKPGFGIQEKPGKGDSVPTPALLPGLFALGAGALRKRKQQTAGAIA